MERIRSRPGPFGPGLDAAEEILIASRMLIMKIKAIPPAVLCCMPSLALAKIRIVTTTEDFAALAREVGGELIEAQSIAKGYQDPHFVQAKPSYLLKLKRADLFVQVGLELDVAWAPALVTNARNPKI